MGDLYMARFAWIAICLLIAAGTPEPARACYMHPGAKIALINENLPKSKLPAAQLKEIETLRDKAREFAWQGKLMEGNQTADKALRILKVKQPTPPAGTVTRC